MKKSNLLLILLSGFLLIPNIAKADRLSTLTKIPGSRDLCYYIGTRKGVKVLQFCKVNKSWDIQKVTGHRGLAPEKSFEIEQNRKGPDGICSIYDTRFKRGTFKTAHDYGNHMYNVYRDQGMSQLKKENVVINGRNASIIEGNMPERGLMYQILHLRNPNTLFRVECSADRGDYYRVDKNEFRALFDSFKVLTEYTP